jgi:septum formation protein
MTLEHLTRLASERPFVLGSASPRRCYLLRETGIAFTQATADLDEARRPGEDPFAYAGRLAKEKALAVAARAHEHAVVLGGDTVVVLGDEILGKPSCAEEAQATLRTLAGQPHIVCTALALAHRGGVYASGDERTTVYFNTVTDDQISEYVATGEPMDKAGAYGIQGMGAFLVDRIEGNLDNVIGLPRLLLDRLARATRHLLNCVTD